MEALFIIHKKSGKKPNIHREMDKQTVVYPFDGILLNNNEQTIDTSKQHDGISKPLGRMKDAIYNKSIICQLTK